MYQRRITAIEAAVIKSSIIANASLVAKCDLGLARLAELARTNPELAMLNARLRDLTVMTSVLDLAPVAQMECAA